MACEEKVGDASTTRVDKRIVKKSKNYSVGKRKQGWKNKHDMNELNEKYVFMNGMLYRQEQ
jgi:hypothetical protein